MCKFFKLSCYFYFLYSAGIPLSQAFFYDFDTQPAQVIPHGQMFVGIRTEYYQDKNNYDFSVTGNTLNVPIFVFMTGFGDKADFYVSWEFQKFIFNDPTHGTISGMGDPSFYIKINLLEKHDFWPSMAFRLGAKEPAALNPFGTDEADIFGTWLFSKSIHDVLNIHLNAGVAILGDRHRNATQKDAFQYGGLIEGRLSPEIKMGVEYSGEYKVQGRWYKVYLYDDDELNRSHLRLGVLTQWNQWHINLHLSFGLINQSESWGTLLGLYYQEKVFD